MSEHLFLCPVCHDLVPLGSKQPNRKMCPQCKITQAREQLLQEHRKRREQYQAQRNDCLLPVSRPLTEAQLADALFDIARKEQLQQCQKCRYSGGKGSNLFCDLIAHKGHSRSKGSGPGDCRSFRALTADTKPDRRKPVSFA